MKTNDKGEFVLGGFTQAQKESAPFLSMDEQESKEIESYYKNLNQNLDDVAINGLMRDKWLENQAELEASRNSASFWEKSKAGAEVYRTNTIVGSIAEGIGFTNYMVNDADFDRQKDFVADKGVILDFSIKHNSNEAEIEQMKIAKSPEHLQAIFESIQAKEQREDLINKTLSTKEQMFAHLTTVGDLDLAVSLGIPVMAGRKLIQVEEAGRKALAIGSATIAGAKPAIVSDTFNQGRKTSDVMLEGILYSSLEAFGVMKLTPELRNTVSAELAESTVRKSFVGSTIRQIDIADDIKTFTSTSPVEVKPHSLIQYPRVADDISESINKAVDNTIGVVEELGEVGVKVEDEIKTIAQEHLTRNLGMRAEISAFANASNDIGEMFTKLKAFITENGLDNYAVAKTITAIRREANLFLQEVRGLDGLTEKELLQIEKTTNQAIDEFKGMDITQTGKLGDEGKTSLDAIKQTISDLRAGGDEALAKYKDVSKITKLKETIASLEEKITGLKSGVKKTKLEQELKGKQQSLSYTRKIMMKQIEDELWDELNSGIRLRKTPDGYKFGNKILSTSAVLGLFATTGAFAKEDDGSVGDVFVSGIGAIVMLGVLGGFGIEAMKSYKNFQMSQIRQMAIRRLDGVGREAELTAKEAGVQSKVMTALRSNYEFVRTSFTETFNPVMQYAKNTGNKELQNLISKIITDPLNGKSQVGELTKERIFQKFLGGYRTVEKDLFKKWYDAQDVKQSWFFEIFSGTMRQQFRELVSAQKEGLYIESNGAEFVNQMAKESHRLIDEHGLKIAEELGLDGLETTRMLDEYVKRSWKHNAQNIIRGMTPESLVEFKNMFKNMYVSAISAKANSAISATKKTEKMFTKFQTAEEFRSFVKENEQTYKAITEFDEEASRLLDDAMSQSDLALAKDSYMQFAKYVNEMASDEKAVLKIEQYFTKITSDSFRGGVADVFSSFKNRLPLDLSQWKNINAKFINGDEGTLEMNKLFERDDFALTSSYMNNLSGRIGLKSVGYSVEEAKEIISKITDSQTKEKMDKVLKVMLGTPLIKATEGQLNAVQIASNASVAMALPLVALSFLQETAMLVGKLGFNQKAFIQDMNNIVDIIRGGGDSGSFVDFFQKQVGLGVNQTIGNVGSRIDLDMRGAGILAGEQNTAVNISRIARDIVFKYSGMLKMSDILEVSNGIANLQLLANIAHGHKKINPALAKKYGLMNSDLQIAKKALVVDEKGFVKVPDYSTLTFQEQERMSNLLWNMGQVGAQRSTIGGTAMWTKDSLLGQSFSRLLMYPMNSFANIGLHQMRSLAHGDIETTVSATLGYVGSYVGMKLRDGLMGREKKDEEYAFYAMLNMPMLAPISLAKGISNPAMLKFPSETFKDVGTLLRGTTGQ